MYESDLLTGLEATGNEMADSTLHHGDNLDILRDHIPDESMAVRRDGHCSGAIRS